MLIFACDPKFCKILYFILHTGGEFFVAYKCRGGVILEEDLKIDFLRLLFDKPK